MRPYKFKIRPFIRLLLAGLGGIFLLTSCASQLVEDRYDYDRIMSSMPGAKTQALEAKSEPLKEIKGPLTLEKAMETALEGNPDVDAAIARITQSEAMMDQARAAFWPMLSLYGGYSQGDAPSGYLFSTIDQRNLPPGANFNDPGWFENYEIGARVRANIFNGGRDWLNHRMAANGLSIRELDREAIQNGLSASVIATWYDCLAAKNFIEIATESLETVKAELRIMKVRFDKGGALKSDVLSLEVRAAHASEELVRAKNNLGLSKAALANLMGMNPDVDFELEEGKHLSMEIPPDYEAGVGMALAKRPELKMARLGVVNSAMEADKAQSEHLPTLDAEIKYYFDDPDMSFSTDRENWTGGLMFNWNVFTGLSTPAGIRKAKALKKEMLAADRKAVQDVLLDLKTSYLNLASADARLTVAEAAVEQSQESLRLVKKQFEGGSATVTRYLDAELAANGSRIREASARFDREKAAASVGRALGIWTSAGENK